MGHRLASRHQDHAEGEAKKVLISVMSVEMGEIVMSPYSWSNLLSHLS